MTKSAMNERAPTSSIIEKGTYVVVQKVGGEHIRVMRLSPKQKVLIEKLKFEADSVFGQPFGLFEVSSGRAVPVCASQLVQDEGVGDIELRDVNGSADSESTVLEECNQENPEVNPAQALQKLSQEDVLSLKGQGISAGELVSKLVEGSKSFSSRTEYAKSKYIRRKTKKHSDRVLILKPTIRLLSRSYYMKDCIRVSNLRVDQLGMILQLAAIHHGKNCVVFDQVLGLVSAAVVDRLGGQGSCIHLHRGLIAQSIPCVHSMNFTEETFSTFLPVRIASILGTAKQEDDQKENTAEDEVIEEGDADVAETEAMEGTSAARKADRLAREKRGLSLLDEGVDSLIIATRTVDPVSVLETIFPKLRPSGSVVIYGPHMEPILDAHRWLMEHDCVNVRLSEQMFRIHQVNCFLGDF
ncbi:eukaryotic initiation factor 3, gamma subunit [Ancylostoma duodenale]|uniref:tRNA (adenine(58)-N(1))-methyltransferase non-catalytic subunit TRM6 n=1 Tax=Ancylostoma duodenale TaxID=51022 RepID=A0A0C2G2Q9_9BILA|nr:eukaryotic initiation factor 3, gamma subunit [Ancylostoma duodenale]